jgi:outer membrane receptor protein involved in Fe transport
MAKPFTWGMLLFATAFSAQATFAQTSAQTSDQTSDQTSPDAASPADDNSADATAGAAADEPVDIAIPGVVISGTRERNIQKSTAEVISVLSAEDVARTGDGDIAGALGRVTGLSVVGNGFVYVRGLGDRYSLALLNGSPLPSPEPLRRAVPLDLFPTDVVASSLVQKTYSPNFTGEFGGGVINLTTLAIPKTPFFSVNLGTSADTETTGHLAYTHHGGGDSDWFGFDRGDRRPPPALRSFFASGERLSSGAVDTGGIAKQLVNADNGLVQRSSGSPANFSGTLNGGTSWLLGESELGIVATAGVSNKWRTNDNLEQSPGSADLSVIDKDYHRITTGNSAVTNGLLGVGYQFGNGNRLRWTNLYIHDTLKRTSLAEGHQNNQRPGADYLEQSTGWYERQLLTTQLTGEFKLDPVTLGARASYSKSKREAPFELDIGYVRTNLPTETGSYFVNRLDNGNTGYARVTFSDLDEELKSAGLDVTTKVLSRLTLTVGYDFTNTERDSKRREFQIVAPSTFPNGAALLRPDVLLSAQVIDTFGIGLIETTETDPAFTARLRTNAGYLQLKSDVTDTVELTFGARYERGEQEVRPLQMFNVLTNSGASTSLEESYVLPAATLTYRFREDMQVRLNASKTIARPQFRELMFQGYFDPDTNRQYFGNPLLVDSELVNAEARYEWYIAPEQRLSVAGFYKKIDRPIEAYTGFNDNTPVTSYANAPEATLYGTELEASKYFDLDRAGDGGFLASRRAVLIGNYTYTTSDIKVDANDSVRIFGTATQSAMNYFRDGSRLTGQSDHLVNLQLGLEDVGRLSQQTILLSYASDRVTSRGAGGLPDIHESPGMRVDFVAREGFSLFSHDMEAKLEVRNLFGRGFRELQQRGGNIVYYNRYDVGTTFSASVTVNF